MPVRFSFSLLFLLFLIPLFPLLGTLTLGIAAAADDGSLFEGVECVSPPPSGRAEPSLEAYVGMR
jgi:hypothetical protein